jgi:hypothetical protein
VGFLGLRRKKQPEPVVEPEVVEPPSGPALVLLAPDARGATSFRMMPFYDVEATLEYLGSLMKAEVPRIHAFWALPERPEQSAEGGEAMVLIRSKEGSELVHVVSFVDIESGLVVCAVRGEAWNGAGPADGCTGPRS